MFIKQLKLWLQNILINKFIYREKAALSGQVILVTGASRGLGNVLARVLLAHGANVIAVARNLENLQSGFKTEELTGKRLICLAADVSKASDVQSVFQVVDDKFTKIDVVINNAGIIFSKVLEKVKESDFDLMISTHLKSTFLVSQAAVSYMKKQKSGFIINIGSKVSHNTRVAAGLSLYSAAKYAIEGFSFALNRELKPWGIRVACLMPGTLASYLSREVSSYLPPRSLAEIVVAMIQFTDVDFESLIVKGKSHQI